jgi:DNA-binding PadR family transcriptional regulator
MSTKLREVVIGLLMERPMHAYALKKVMGPRLPPDELLNDGILYPLLSKLSRDGLIEGTEDIGPGGKPRRVFAVTPAGREAFADWLRSPDNEADEATYDFFLGHPLLAKVQFFSHLSPPERRAKFSDHIERTQAKLREYRSIREEMLERQANPFRVQLLDLGAAHHRQTLRWLKALMAADETGPSGPIRPRR